MQLLVVYTGQLFGKSNIEKTMLEYKDNLWGKNGLAYIIGRQSLEFFCLYFLQDTFRQKENNTARKLDNFHFEMWNKLQSMWIDDAYDKLELCMPRGSSKTTTCDFALSIWLHCYGISQYTLVLSNTNDQAIQFVKNIKNALLENPYIINAFGTLINKIKTVDNKYVVNSQELELTNNTKIQACGAGTSIRGSKYGDYRPTCIISDDYQGKEDVLTAEARNKKWKTWKEEVEPAGDMAVYTSHAHKKTKKKMATKFIVLGTILHTDCYMSRLLNDVSYEHIIKQAVLVDDIDTYFNNGLWAELKKIYLNRKNKNSKQDSIDFYNNHYADMQYPTLWADKYDCFETALQYFNDPMSFKQELQNDAKHKGERIFTSISTFTDAEEAEELAENNFGVTILCCDPAVGTGTHNDYTALCVASRGVKNLRWIRNGIIDKFLFDSYIDKVIELLKEYLDITLIWVEKNTFNGTDVIEIKQRIANDDELSQRHIKILNENQYKNKENKIMAISGKVNNGYISFNENDTEFIKQIQDFCGCKQSAHDDAPDIVAEADRLLNEVKQERPKLKLFKLY